MYTVDNERSGVRALSGRRDLPRLRVCGPVENRIMSRHARTKMAAFAAASTGRSRLRSIQPAAAAAAIVLPILLLLSLS